MQKRLALCVFNLGGGVGSQRVNLAREFVKRGFTVDLVYAHGEPGFLQELPTEVRLVRLSAPSVPKMLPKLVKYLRANRPDGMISAVDYMNVVAILARKISGVNLRLVVSVHTSIVADADNQVSIRGRLKPLLFRYIYPMADEVVVVSEEAKAALQEAAGIPNHQIHRIYNPAYTDELLHSTTAIVDHPWLNNTDVVLVLAVGRLTASKDYSSLIRAFSILRKQLNAKLLILGEGPLRSQLQQEIEDGGLTDHVDMPGFVTNVTAYMARASVCVLSSAWEGFGNVLVEAMAVGTPVVSTDCKSGPAEILDYGRFGKLTPVGDVKALADAIVATVKRPLPAEILAERARCFSAERAVDSYIDVLNIQPNASLRDTK